MVSVQSAAAKSREFAGTQHVSQLMLMQVNPPWGDYFGVVSQSVTTAIAATEVEVTVVTDQQLFEIFKQGNAEWNSLQHPVLYKPERTQLHNGENKVKLYVSCFHYLNG